MIELIIWAVVLFIGLYLSKNAKNFGLQNFWILIRVLGVIMCLLSIGFLADIFFTKIFAGEDVSSYMPFADEY